MKWEFIFDVCTIILAVLSAFIGLKVVTLLLLLVAGVAIAATAMKKLSKPINKMVAIISVSLFTLLGLVYYAISAESKDDGDLQIRLNVFLFGVDGAGSSEQCTTVPDKPLKIKNASLVCIENGTTYDYSDFKNNVLLFSQLQAGTYKLSLEFKNYRLNNETFLLNEDDLKDGKWIPQTVTLTNKKTLEDLGINIAFQDKPNENFAGGTCTFYPTGSDQAICVPLNSDGSLKSHVSCMDNIYMDIEVESNGRKQKQSFTICSSNNITKKNETDSENSGNESDASIVDNKGNEKSDENNDVLYEDNKIYLMFHKPGSNKSDEMDEINEIEGTDETDGIGETDRADELDAGSLGLESGEETSEHVEEAQRSDPGKLLSEQGAVPLGREAFSIYQQKYGKLSVENPIEKFEVNLSADSYWIEFQQAYLQDFDAGFWNIEIVDDFENVYLEFTAGADSKGISEIVELEAGKYYVQVKSDGGDGVFDLEYTWSLKKLNNVQASDATEKYGSQQEYKVNFYYGNINQSYDSDSYSFLLESESVMAFKFEHPELPNQETYWTVILKNASGDILRTLLVRGNDTDVISDNIALQAGRYDIEVYPGENYYSTEIYAISMACYTCSY